MWNTAVNTHVATNRLSPLMRVVEHCLLTGVHLPPLTWFSTIRMDSARDAEHYGQQL